MLRVLIAILCLGGPTLADELRYANSRFGTSASLPMDVAPLQAPENGDGYHFSRSGLEGTISIYGSHNIWGGGLAGYRKELSKSFETIIFNVSHRLSTDEILAFGHLKGLFYQEETIENMAKQCKDIINGENCLPSKVSAQLLYYYRSVVDSQTTPATVDLTIRELQILRCLISGASNTQIAEDMFISEFTVKSHLQKIFKKLCVKNRAQAASWARQHMNPIS